MGNFARPIAPGPIPPGGVKEGELTYVSSFSERFRDDLVPMAREIADDMGLKIDVRVPDIPNVEAEKQGEMWFEGFSIWVNTSDVTVFLDRLVTQALDLFTGRVEGRAIYRT